MTALTLSRASAGGVSGLSNKARVTASNSKSSSGTTRNKDSSNGGKSSNDMASSSAASRASRQQQHTSPINTLITVNPYLNDYIDCIENLPNRIQLLLTELRSVDVQVKGIYIYIYSRNYI